MIFFRQKYKQRPIPSGATGDFPLGDIIVPEPVSIVKIGAEDYGFTASLKVRPVLPEGQ